MDVHCQYCGEQLAQEDGIWVDGDACSGDDAGIHADGDIHVPTMIAEVTLQIKWNPRIEGAPSDGWDWQSMIEPEVEVVKITDDVNAESKQTTVFE